MQGCFSGSVMMTLISVDPQTPVWNLHIIIIIFIIVLDYHL